MAVALYPGTFDPVTLGHLDIAVRASKIFEKVIVGIYSKSQRALMFTVEERIDMFKKAVAQQSNIEVRPFEGLVVHYARQVGAQVIVRGLRSGVDFDYEYDMAFMNKKLDPDIELVCLVTRLEYQFIRASLLKEVAALGGDIRNLVPPHVAEALRKKREQSR